MNFFVYLIGSWEYSHNFTSSSTHDNITTNSIKHVHWFSFAKITIKCIRTIWINITKWMNALKTTTKTSRFATGTMVRDFWILLSWLQFKFPRVDLELIEKEIIKLRCSKAAGYGKIPVKFVKDAADILSKLLAAIFKKLYWLYNCGHIESTTAEMIYKTMITPIFGNCGLIFLARSQSYKNRMKGI